MCYSITHFSQREQDGNYKFDRTFLHVETCNLGFYGSKIELLIYFTDVIETPVIERESCISRMFRLYYCIECISASRPMVKFFDSILYRNVGEIRCSFVVL